MDSLSQILFRTTLHPDQHDAITLAHTLLGQMRIGLFGGASTIPMLPTKLTCYGEEPKHGQVAVAHIDDTQIQTSLVKFQSKQTQIETGESFPLPGIDYPCTFEELVFAIVELLEPFLQDADQIALCLPFPMKDDCILSLPPTIHISEYLNASLSSAVASELEERGFSVKPITCIPSVCAAQTSAVRAMPNSKRICSLYWGYGTNTAFSMPSTAILKLYTGDSALQMVNCVSGNCEAMPIGTLDLSIDRDSADPGKKLLDKMVSIQNIGEVFRLAMLQTTEAKLVSFMCGRHFLSLSKLPIDTFVSFLEAPEGDNLLAHFCQESKEDLQIALAVANAVLSRCVNLLCANLASTLYFTGAGKDAENPAVISLFGEAFHHTYLSKYFETAATKLLKDSLNLHCVFYPANNSLTKSIALCAAINS